MARVLLEERDGPAQKEAHVQCGSIPPRALGIPPEGEVKCPYFAGGWSVHIYLLSLLPDPPLCRHSPE